MARKPPISRCSEEYRKTSIRTIEAWHVERAKIIIGRLERKGVSEITRDLKIRSNTEIEWLRLFEKGELLVSMIVPIRVNFLNMEWSL